MHPVRMFIYLLQSFYHNMWLREGESVYINLNTPVCLAQGGSNPGPVLPNTGYHATDAYAIKASLPIIIAVITSMVE